MLMTFASAFALSVFAPGDARTGVQGWSMLAARDHHAEAAAAPVTTSEVGGATMYSNWTVVQNASASPIHSKLVAAIGAAGLVDALSGDGPFTVFAPTDEVFDRLDPAQLAALMQPENREQLAALLTYHVVAERITAEDLAARITAGGGSARLTTVQGAVLTASMEGTNIVLTGMNGGRAYVTQADVMNSNGVTHVINGILVPST